MEKSSTLVGIIAILGLATALNVPPHFDREWYNIKVESKERIVESSGETTSSKYLIWTTLSNGEKKVFENTDSFIEMKFNSSDVYGQLEVGKEYKIKTYGWRIPLFSKYENIINVKAK